MKLIILISMLLLVPFACAQESAGREDPLTLIRIERAKADIRGMEELGVGTAFVKDELEDAEKALVEKDYELVLEKTESISDRKKRALDIHDSLRALELRIEEVSKIGDTAKAREKLHEADNLFKMENYPEAEDAIFEGGRYLRQVEGEYSVVKARYRASRAGTALFVKDTWRELASSILLVLAVILISYPVIKKMRYENMLEDMKLEKKVLIDLIRKVQKEYFGQAAISRRSYDIKIEKYRENLVDLNENIKMYEAKVA